MFMWRSAPGFSSFTKLVSQPAPEVAETVLGAPQRRPNRVTSHSCRGAPPRRIRSSPVSPTTTETGLRETVLALAGELTGGARLASSDHARASAARGLRRLLHERGAAARASRGRSAARAGPAAGRPAGRRLGEQLQRFEVAGPGFLNLFLSDAWHRTALAELLAAGESFGCGGAPRRRADHRRVRLGQSNRSDARRSRPQRRLRRCAGTGASFPWAQRGARVLCQRRRFSGVQARRVDRGARARGARCPRTATTATT